MDDENAQNKASVAAAETSKPISEPAETLETDPAVVEPAPEQTEPVPENSQETAVPAPEDAQELLHCSDASATRYLAKLVGEGRLGKTDGSHWVKYQFVR